MSRAISIAATGGLRVTTVEIAAAIESIVVPSPERPINAVLRYAEPRAYQTDPYYLGLIVDSPVWLIAPRPQDRL